MTEDQKLELFTIKTKFFREIPHPKLILKAISQVEKMVSVPPILNDSGADFEKSELIPVLKSYTQKVYDLKTAIAQATGPEELFIALNELYNQHWPLIIKLKSYLPALPQFPDGEIKQSDPIDPHAILNFINSAKLAENEIKTYICNEIEAVRPDEFSMLTKACLQSQKIVNNA